MRIEIRELEERDVEALSEIESASFSMPWSAQDFKSLLDRDYCFYLVAEVDGVVAGCAGYTDSCKEGSIDNVVIAEQFRRRGVGIRLLKELISRGEARGMEAFTLEVRVSNTPAIRLYEQCGFTSVGIRPGFYEKPTEDAMIMWRR